LRRRACSTVLCALAFFALFQLLFNLVIHNRRIDLRDPEFGYKLATLRSCIRQNPNRPLLLILGSSRTELGVVPSELQLASAGSDKGPLAFNMSLSGSGPLLELMCLKRILAEGIHPRWIMMEVLPASLVREPVWSDTAFLDIRRINFHELTLLRQYHEIPDQLFWRWIEAHVVPFYTHRFLLLSHYAPSWLPDQARCDDWRFMDLHGFRYGIFRFMEPESAHQFRILFAENQYAPILQGFKISDQSDRAMHELLNLCLDQHIQPLLYLMPEGEWFRSWYTPSAQRTLGTYLEKLTKEYGLPLVDARTWHHEIDFVDSHHLLEPAAYTFSKRLGSEINRTCFLDKDSHKPTSVTDSLAHTRTEGVQVAPLPD
jgi:hypothetical protein